MAPRVAVPSARGSTASSLASSTRSATSSARRLGGERAGSTSSSTSSNRSPRPTCARVCSASAGLDTSTRNPSELAWTTPSSQSVDFPMPAPPSITSAAGPGSVRPRKSRSEASSCSRPTISTGILVRSPSQDLRDENPAPYPGVHTAHEGAGCVGQSRSTGRPCSHGHEHAANHDRRRPVNSPNAAQESLPPPAPGRVESREPSAESTNRADPQSARELRRPRAVR